MLSVSDIVFRVNYDQSDGVIKFSDLTDYAVLGVEIEDVSGMVKIVSPTGVNYINPGWETDDFTAPDVSGSTSLVNDTDFTFSVVNNFAFGSWYFYYKVKNGTNAPIEVLRKFDYRVPVPAVSAVPVFNRTLSTLTLTDASDYKINFTYSDLNSSSSGGGGGAPSTSAGGQPVVTIPIRKSIVPATITRNMVIRPPLSTGLDDSTSTAPTVVFGPNCWTGSYDLYIQSTVTYYIEKWGSRNWVQATFSVYYEDELSIDDSVSEFERYSACITAINEKYEGFLSSNPKKAQEYEVIVNKISFYYGLYNIYKNKGVPTSYVTNKLLELLRKFSLCDIDITSGSVEIIPIGGGTQTVETNEWLQGDEEPASTLGGNDDFYLNTSTSWVYQKKNGVWGHILTIGGAGALRDSVLVTTDYSITNADDFVLVEAGVANIILVLDEISSFDDEKIITIKAKKKDYNIRIEAATGNTVETRAYYDIQSEGDTIKIRPYGTNWEIV
jgi:hypothetical protein